jgi:hypothetical protein
MSVTGSKIRVRRIAVRDGETARIDDNRGRRAVLIAPGVAEDMDCR